MNIICDAKKCTGCAACKNICPKNAITMIEDDKGFKYPKINNELCINCKLCQKQCPTLKSLDSNLPLKILACKNINNDIRITSSSGGVFQELANYILNKNGSIFGAAFDEEFKVKHIEAINVIELEKLKRSKYVQSDIDVVYNSFKKAINKKKNILFSGTPCQVQAIKNFIPKDTDNIFLVDILCHGVPSPIVNINFRFKNENSTQNISIDFENGKNYTSYRESGDLFYNLFLNDIILRKSCYDCIYKQVPRISDITLADFWGIEHGKAKILNDNKGVTLVLVNTQKGLELFDKIKEHFEYTEVTQDDCVKYNCFSNFKKPNNYEKFWNNYLKNGLKESKF